MVLNLPVIKILTTILEWVSPNNSVNFKNFGKMANVRLEYALILVSDFLGDVTSQSLTVFTILRNQKAAINPINENPASTRNTC